MRLGLVFGIIVAVLVHLGIILFAGQLFFDPEKDEGTLQVVDLLSETEVEKEDEKKLEPEPEDIQPVKEEAPDATKIIQALEKDNAAPKLDAASLGELASALQGLQGSSDFGAAMSLESGGVIGGTGTRGSSGDQVEAAFSLVEIDQRPQATYQAAPVYPSEMRGKKVEGVVTVIFIVDAAGKVTSPRIEKSTHAAFEKPALDAVKRWKFEPGVKGGERVACKMRVPIRFQPS